MVGFHLNQPAMSLSEEDDVSVSNSIDLTVSSLNNTGCDSSDPHDDNVRRMHSNTSRILELFCHELKKLIAHFIPMVSLKLLVEHFYDYCRSSTILPISSTSVQTTLSNHPIHIIQCRPLALLTHAFSFNQLTRVLEISWRGGGPRHLYQ
ncbi:hypothetical protein Tco_1317689 [Tanacetum coccineum]